jgi:phage shock protein A
MSQQGIVGRVMQLARADVDAMIDSAEDRPQMLDQLVMDYGAHISGAEHAIAQTVDNLRMIKEDQREEARAAQQWGKKAQAASNKADELRAAGRAGEANAFDDLARIALERELMAQNDVRTVQHTIDAQNESVAKLKAGLHRMKVKQSDLKRKRDKLVMHPRSAQARSRPHASVRGLDIMDPTSEVARFEEKVRREEARVRGQQKLAASSLDAQFASIEDPGNSAEVESRLKALKAGRAAAARQATSRRPAHATSRKPARIPAARKPAHAASRRKASLY